MEAAVVAEFKVYHDSCLEGLRKTTELRIAGLWTEI
jgi:hypothetical protein